MRAHEQSTAGPITEDSVIAGLYRAAHGEIEWREALDPLSQLSGSWVTQLLGIDLTTQGVAYTYEGGWSKSDAVVEYVRRYHAVDPHLNAVLQNELGIWYHSSDHFDDKAISTHAYYQDFLLPFGNRYISATKIAQDETSIVVLAFVRADGCEPFDDPHKKLLQRVGFHMQEAIAIWRKQRITLRDAAIGRDLLDRMSGAVMIIDAERRIVVANRLARDALDAHQIIYERGGLLQMVDPKADLEITIAVRQLQLVTRMGDEAGGRLDRAFVRVQFEARSPVVVALVAMRPETTLGAFGARTVAMVLVHDFSARANLDPIVVSSAYNLTPAEAKVAVAVAGGQVPKQIAAAHGVAVSTVRTQIRAIYDRLQVRSARELVALLGTGPGRL